MEEEGSLIYRNKTPKRNLAASRRVRPLRGEEDTTGRVNRANSNLGTKSISLAIEYPNKYYQYHMKP